MRRPHRLILAVVLAVATSAGAGTVTVRLDPQGEPPDNRRPALAGRLHVEHAGGDPVGAGERTVDVTEPVIELDLPASTWWRVRLEAPGWWSPPSVLTVDAGELRLALHRTGKLAVVTKSPRGELPPDELTVHFQPPPEGLLRRSGEATQRDRGPRGTTACRSEEQQTAWVCELPAGVYDLRFRAPGFASVFRWATVVEPGERRALPTLDLIAGAAVFGWIEWPAGDLAPEDVVVRVTPTALMPETPQTRRMSFSVHPSQRGLFQFGALAPGTYRLSAEAPGWSPVERRSLQVLEGRETELLTPLEFLPPATVEICVDPPAPPGVRVAGDTWKLALYPDRSEFRPPTKDFVDEGGCWTASDLRPGRYRLVVEDGRQSEWMERDVIIEPGAARLNVELPLVPIEGDISRDGSPIRARLTFRQRVAPEGDPDPYERSVVIFSDPEGRFTGALPDAGLWQVGAALSRHGGEQVIASVEVERPARGAYEMSFDVSKIRLEGRVVTASGSPVRSASVRLLPEAEDAGYSRGRTDRRGRFEFEGVPPGIYRVHATAREGSAQTEVEVQEFPPPPEVEIVLVEQHEIDGLVIGRNGPVFGAQVQVYPELASPRQVSVQTETTNAQGRFSIQVPVDAMSLRVLILAPGHAATALQIAPQADAPLPLPVDELAGTLILEAEGALPHSARLVFDGVPIFLAQLRDWLHIQGGQQSAARWVLPAMAIGDYQLCPSASVSATSCASAYLPPLGTTALALQDADHASE